MSWIWQGRQLTTAEKGGTTLSYTYDSEGIRTSKSDGTNTTKYLLNGTQILAQTTNGTTLSFFYDQQGNRVGMADGSNHFYYYIYNLQGDVIALADATTGKLVVTYTYDAWGKVLSINDTTANSVGIQNPFRYRGYYYDSETGLYYLQSRYYDAETGRWISAEPNIDFGEFDEGTGVLGYNVYAYCANNPVNNFDPDGEALANVVGAIFGGATGALLWHLLADALGLKGWRKAALIAAATVGGAALGAFLDPYIAKLGSKIAALTTRTAKIGTSFGKIGKLV